VPRILQAWFRLKLLPFLVWAVAITCVTWRAYALEVPPLEGRVNDRAGLLSPATKERLTARLAAHEQATGAQIAILTLDSLEGAPIEDYSMRVVEAWKLGKKGQDNGVLLLIAKNDHKMRIEVGYGLEGTLPDILAGRIVRDVLAPRFKQGDFDGGVSRAVEAIIGKTGGEAQAVANDGDEANGQTDNREAQAQKAAPQKPTGVFGFVISVIFGLLKFIFLLFFIVIFIVFSLLSRLGGGRRGGGFFVGGGGSGGGGGGFDSFSGGGGGFGGGGASGDW
jgi:uncharacterized protein